MKLRIADDLSLPTEAVTETFAILAKRGMGKTYTAAVMAEEMLKVRAQVIVCDPVGVWWGLRVAADGKSPGLPIVVMGGEHGDLTLDEGTGAIVAEFCVDTASSVVLDLGLLRKGAMIRFMTDFAEKLYHAKAPEARRSPVHLFLDEADAFAPQKPQPDQARLLGAMQDLVRRGRARGIGVSMITQRSAVLNKDVLTQAEVLVPLRTISPQDRKAIEEWIDIHADRTQAKEVLESLPSLPKGTAWFWSPGWLDICQKIQVRRRETFDSSATPEFGKSYKNIQLAPVDLDALKTKLAATIEKAKADDPKELRKKITELERALAVASQAVKSKLESRLENIDREKLMEAERAEIDRIIKGSIIPQFKKVLWRVQEWTVKSANDIQQSADWITQQIEAISDESKFSLAFVSKEFEKDAKQAISIGGIKMKVDPTMPAGQIDVEDSGGRRPLIKNIGSSNGDASLPKGERIVLTAIAQFQDGVDKNQLSVLTGYKRSSRDTYVSRLKERGLIDDFNGKIVATASGTVALGDDYEPLPTGRALYDHYMTWLPRGERIILEVIYKYPKGIDRQQLDDMTEFKRSSRDTYLSRLAARRLVSVPRPGVVAPSENLF